MPNLDYTIKKLEEQKRKVNQGDLEVWLNTTHSYIEDQFKSYSTRARNFQSLINDYGIQKIGDSYGKGIDKQHFRSKALEYIEECVSFLNDKLEEEKTQTAKKAEQETKKEPMKRMKNFDNFSNSGAKTIPAPPLEKPRTKLPFGIAPGLFWTIFVSIFTGAFLLGLYLGQNRFDKEKSDWYDENKELKKEIQTVQEQAVKQEEYLTKIIGEKDQQILRLEKQLKEKNK